MSTTPEVTLRRARPEEAAALAAISTRAFDTDLAVGAPRPGGPPGYDSSAWQREAMNWGTYYAIVVDGQLAGGAIVVDKTGGDCHLARVFLDPDHHRRGIGRRVVALLDDAYPQARRWTLDTPVWNRRTRAFYGALGFVDIGRLPTSAGFELVLYERRVEAAGP
jgi:ribosomal protein S18 acetylase RimI-like enzyme